jgi:hypothetical protein
MHLAETHTPFFDDLNAWWQVLEQGWDLALQEPDSFLILPFHVVHVFKNNSVKKKMKMFNVHDQIASQVTGNATIKALFDVLLPASSLQPPAAVEFGWACQLLLGLISAASTWRRMQQPTFIFMV